MLRMGRISRDLFFGNSRRDQKGGRVVRDDSRAVSLDGREARWDAFSGIGQRRGVATAARDTGLVQGNDPQRSAGVREGDVLAGKYRVERVLGMGGMGVVVAARHLQLDTKVAIKFLLPTMLEDRDAATRFAREARAAVKITSEHVARVFDVGTLETGAPYMVMEYLDGEDLAAWLKQRGALSVEQAIDFVLQACVAVADAHVLGIVHRDLKPANLFCVQRSDGQLSIKVLDFGISKLAEAAGTRPGMAMTRTAALMGSPLYMSPEQMRSARDVDAQTDIWALGVILFELMTGRPPFQAESVTELAIKVNNEPTPAIRGFRPEVPALLEAAIFKCLEKDRRRRFRNVAELALALLPFAPKRARASVERISGIIEGAGLSASALAQPSSPPMTSTLVAPGTVAPVGRTTGGSRSRRTAIGAGVVGVLAMVAIAGSLLLLRHPHGGGEDLQASGLQGRSPTDPREASDPSVSLLRGTSGAPPPTTLAAIAQLQAAPSAAQTPTSGPPDASTVSTVSVPEARASPTTRPAMPRPLGGALAGVRPAPSVPASPAAPAPPTAGRPSCNPPYVIDSAGDRQYKPECL